MSPVKLRRLVRHVTFAEGVAAVWSILSAVSVGVVVPLFVLPEMHEIIPAGAFASAHVQRVLNPWVGHVSGGLSAVILGVALFWPMRQEVARLMLIGSLVSSLSVGFYTSWVLSGVLG